MITITGPAVAIIAVIGYLGINSIANWVSDLFRKDTEKDEPKK